MDPNSNDHLPDEKFDDPADRKNDPTADLNREMNTDLDPADDDRNIDIQVKHSGELPEGDDVDLNRAE